MVVVQGPATEVIQHGQEIALVVHGQFLVQGALVDRFGQQFSNIAALGGVQLAARYRPFGIPSPALQQGSPVVVDENLQRHPEGFAVPQYRLVMVGNTGRSHIRVEVIFVIEIHRLHGAELFQHVAAAYGQIAPAGTCGRLQDGAVISQFV